jgi:hypothetical protein
MTTTIDALRQQIDSLSATLAELEAAAHEAEEELSVVSEEEKEHSPTMKFLLAWGGVKNKTYAEKVLSDGSKFRAWPRQHGPTWGWMLRGASDISGEKFRPVNDNRPCWNVHELDGPFLVKDADSPYLDRIRNYDGEIVGGKVAVRQDRAGNWICDDPQGWPKLYKDAWNEGH